MKDVLMLIATLIFGATIIYAGYWVTKNVSYAIFYESMVQETIIENVKKSCIKGE